MKFGRGLLLQVLTIVLMSVREYLCGKIVESGAGCETRCRRAPFVMTDVRGSQPSSTRPEGMLLSLRKAKSLVADVASSWAPVVCSDVPVVALLHVVVL